VTASHAIETVDIRRGGRRSKENGVNTNALELSGLEPLRITPEFGSPSLASDEYHWFAKVVRTDPADDFESALTVARQQVQGGANLLDGTWTKR